MLQLLVIATHWGKKNGKLAKHSHFLLQLRYIQMIEIHNYSTVRSVIMPHSGCVRHTSIASRVLHESIRAKVQRSFLLLLLLLSTAVIANMLTLGYSLQNAPLWSSTLLHMYRPLWKYRYLRLCQKGDVFLPSPHSREKCFSHTQLKMFTSNFSLEIAWIQAAHVFRDPWQNTGSGEKKTASRVMRLEQRGTQQKFTSVAWEEISF